MLTGRARTQATGSAAAGSEDTALQIHKPKKQQSESVLIDRVIGESLKLLGIAGTFVYGALFMGYRAYYSALGIRPEDVGVSHSFILSRSIVFIFIAGVVAVTVVFLVEVVAAHPKITCREYLLMAIVTGLVFWYFVRLLPTLRVWWVDLLILGGFLIPGAIFIDAVYNMLRKRAWNSGLALTVLVAIMIPAAALAWRAHELGERSIRGLSVTPFKIADIPVLDVSTEQIYAEWICRKDERPLPLFFRPKAIIEGTLLGETSSNIFIRVPQRDPQGHRQNLIIKLPQECVMLGRYRTYHDADDS